MPLWTSWPFWPWSLPAVEGEATNWRHLRDSSSKNGVLHHLKSLKLPCVFLGWGTSWGKKDNSYIRRNHSKPPIIQPPSLVSFDKQIGSLDLLWKRLTLIRCLKGFSSQLPKPYAQAVVWHPLFWGCLLIRKRVSPKQNKQTSKTNKRTNKQTNKQKTNKQTTNKQTNKQTKTGHIYKHHWIISLCLQFQTHLEKQTHKNL